jgi:hypothetical protein
VSDDAGALAALDRIVSAGGDADDVLREVVRVLAERHGYAAIRFVEGEDLVPGPEVGTPEEAVRSVPVTFQGRRVAERVVSPSRAEDEEFLEQLAALVAPYCLVGWDTGGARWMP